MTRPQDLRLEHNIQKTLVVLDPLLRLVVRQDFFRLIWQRWHDCLRERSQQVIPQRNKVLIESFDRPLHRVRLDRHHAVVVVCSAEALRRDVLLHTGDDAAHAAMLVQHCVFGEFGLLLFQETLPALGTIECLIEKFACRCIQLRRDK